MTVSHFGHSLLPTGFHRDPAGGVFGPVVIETMFGTEKPPGR